MKMSMTQGMRMEQRMKLAPRMIQSMEVLQLPLLALQEKIESELNSNPVLEQDEPTVDENDVLMSPDESTESSDNIEERELIVKDDSDNVEDFQRLDSIEYNPDDYSDYTDHMARRSNSGSGEKDKKLEALRNTAAQTKSLNDLLVEQWRLVEADELVKQAGDKIINYIDEKGYLTVRIEQLHNKDKHKFTMEHLYKALELIQMLEPAGVGARDVRECFLIQMAQIPDDMSFEVRLVSDYWDDLLDNRLPQIAKKMKCTMEQLNNAILRMSRLDSSPGLVAGRNDNHPITADIIVEPKDDGTGYVVTLADTRIPSLRVNDYYSKMSRDRKIDTKAREFLQQNIRSAQWLMDAIEQRKNTLLKVATAVVKFQKDFFDKGKLFLKPLPMATVAEEVGVHIATVSRAVSGKYIQYSDGILPLREFFSGGMEADDGQQQSWSAVREKIKQIIDTEDKSKPLSDDVIRDKLQEMGAGKIARRTVAKYRKLMNIPTARFRKKY
ncbi:MAG: RNA polymerase factor sigma-54 [Sedimentisphaerales bacterium]|nr:RNA polymerase factor sigma-54 [Sedimentisphaerales bacterium]